MLKFLFLEFSLTKQVQILEKADVYKAVQANVCFKDGFLMIYKHLKLWATFGVISIVLQIIMTLFGNVLSVFGDIFYFIVLYCDYLVVFALLLTAYQLMSQIADNKNPLISSMFNIFSIQFNRQLAIYTAIVVICFVPGLLLIQTVFVSHIPLLNEQLAKILETLQSGSNLSLNQLDQLKVFLIYTLSIFLWKVLVFSLFWGVWPIINENKSLPFKQVFTLQLLGTIRNWRLILALTFYFAGAFILYVIVMQIPMINLIGVIIFLLFGQSLIMAISFTTARHIFMRW